MMESVWNDRLSHSRMIVEWWDEDEMAVFKIELTAETRQNRGFLLVESSRVSPVSPGWEWIGFEWYWIIRMIQEWWTEGGMMSTVIPGVASSQSTHHPLQRMMGGLTCRFEWYWMIRMISKWWSQSFQGVAASQSTHHPLQRMMGGLTCRFGWYWMIRMISEWWSQFGMMD